MEWTQLNVFQRVVRKWDAHHPYNAAQVMRLEGRADAARLAQAWLETLADLGLGRVRVAGEWFQHQALNGNPSDVARMRQVSGAALCDFLTDELNRPFDTFDGFPFRAFALDSGDCHYAGIVYHHWVADSASIRRVIREWFLRRYEPSRASRSPLEFPSHGYWHYFGPRNARWELPDAVFGTVRWSARIRRARRVDLPDFDSYRVHFSTHELAEGLVEPLLAHARRRGATLNDVFIAALAEACDVHRVVRLSRKRRDMVLGSIVDLRPMSRADMSNLFGLFLGFTSVVCRPQDLVDWDQLLRRITAQSAMHRNSLAAQSSMIRMALGLVAHRIAGEEKMKNVYRKRLPIAGGVSNVNLNRDWAAEFHPSPLIDYIRVSPCGPMMPIVFTPTTLGNRLNFGLTCRDVVLPRCRSGAVADTFSNRLVRFADPGA
ncbi:MAG: condensation domain-containing protein [Tepidisphaeraceae bacterium]